jgi:hypothetical protein
VTNRMYLLDERGVPDLSKYADLYCIGSEALRPAKLGNPNGKIIVSWQPNVGYHNTIVAGQPGSYNQDLWRAASIRGALTGLTVWTGTDGWHTEAIDITKPGMVMALFNLWVKHFPWSHGVVEDPGVPLTWELPQLAPLDDAWRTCLMELAIRWYLWRPDYLVIAQNASITPGMVVCNGEFWERSPEYNGMSMLKHSQQAAAFPGVSPHVFVAQVRNPELQSAAYLATVRAWAADPGAILGAPGSLAPFYLCLGQDATAQGAM